MPTKAINLGGLWRSAQAFGAGFIFTIGARYTHQSSDTTKASRHIPYFPFPDLDTFLKSRPFDCQLVAVEIASWSRDLTKFVHPQRCIYILGPENGSLGMKIISHCQAAVEIPTKYCLNVTTAGSIVMYDRMVKYPSLKNGAH